MTSTLRKIVGMLVLMTLLTGIAYPLAVTGLAQLIFPDQANGSLIRRGDKIVGSALIGQYFSRPEYFHSRPSAAVAPAPPAAGAPPPASYDAAYSGATNLAPSSKKLIDQIADAARAARADNPGRPVPVDLVTASASGLDPHISPAAALFQVPRVAAARGMSEDQLRALVARFTEGRTLGLLGQPRVNVLQLNLALDAAAAGK
jgi:K+-transporting ATPase ATPase C chain